MKTAKRLLALTLVGLMLTAALALLTGCSGEKSEDRLIAEGIGNYMKEQNPRLDVSYSVSELKRNIRPVFSEDWFQKDEGGNAIAALDRTAVTKDGRTVEEFLSDSLKKYKQSSFASFTAFDATGKSIDEQVKCFFGGGASSLTVFYKNVSPSTYTKLTVGVCHKIIGEKEYCLIAFAFS